TYRNRPKSSLRREYALFFAFNLVGLFIEVGAVSVAKYWLHRTDLLVLNIFSLLGIGLGTVFRFWAYRTHVFKLAPAAPTPAPGLARAPARPAWPRLPMSERSSGRRGPATGQRKVMPAKDRPSAVPATPPSSSR